ncbi:hypothetical protein UVI_02061780 [Ustilaginoidea virens]|uniref:DNA-directed RNA polymerase subunit n=2 Tax=Ustilaginoidea virens TaxID=1159556 RepID=A0A1B5L7B6_USTVR|nr:hypothetical protein UVI_02061780 [Ustilaginoidea virens]
MAAKMPVAASPEPGSPKHDKKSSKEKSAKSEKKRAREEDVATADGERKHKKSKSVTADAVRRTDDTPSGISVKKEKEQGKKKQKDRKLPRQENDDAAHPDSEKKKKKKRFKEDPLPDALAEPSKVQPQSDKKDKKKKKKKHDEVDAAGHAGDTVSTQPDVDAMDVDQPPASDSSKIYHPPDIPANPQFPFFSQTVALYEPIYPVGWAHPVTHARHQHLQHLQNKYVPSLRGVLLDYKNVSVGPEPGRAGAATDDETVTTVESKREYAVGFGWITADVELFVPSRGAWMEGSVNLQTEGHIGVVCFGRFNASIEARRLPPSWKWVSNESTEAHGFEETASVVTADDHGVVRQIHSTGFWTDGSGGRVKGRIRFRIRNFDVGMSGDTSYLSLEGTMLDSDGEKKLVKEEARIAQVRREKKDGQKIGRRRAPDFSMTRFAEESEETTQEVAGTTQS